MRFTFPRWLFLPLAALLAFGLPAQAQVSAGGTPPSYQHSLVDLVPTVALPTPDIARHLAEDETTDNASAPWRFGAHIPVDFGLDNSGIWSTLPDGGRVWRLRLLSTGAYSLNLLYDQFELPAGAEFFLYTDDQSQTIGAFTEYNSASSPDGTFATQPTPGDVVVLEYHEPVWAAFHGSIHINSVVHAYRNVFGRVEDDRAYGDSGTCHNNINCPVGAPWQNDKHAVTMIISGGAALCSGSMINNTAQDRRQFYLTANHCGVGTGSFVFVFNYEAPTCTNANVAYTSATGCTLLATSTASDFTLVEITENIPTAYNAFFAGWSKVDVAATSSTCIHHPSGDIKKISFSNTPTTNDTWSGTPANSHWRATWSSGVTEGGSSGSPLFDQNHRIIGQLHGGPSSCASPTYDVYGKFSLSWTGGGTNSTRLSNWLDPTATGATVLDGIFDMAPTLPALTLGGVTVQDGNDGALDPSETPTLVITLANAGAAASTIAATLSETSPYITVTDAAGAWPNIASGGSAASTNSFIVSVAANTPAGHVASFSLAVTAAGGYTTTLTFSLVSGLTVESFETGNFSSFNWTQGGNLPWTVATDQFYTGTRSAKSGAIAHSQTSTLNLGLQVSASSTMSFYYKVSSEANYDFLTFYIDGVQQARWSGEVAWTLASYTLAAGAHTCAWTYSKDGSVVSGSDCAWIDEIVMPALGVTPVPDIAITPASLSATLAPGATGTGTLTLANVGQATLNWTASSATALLSNNDGSEPANDRAAGGPDAFGYRWKDSNEPGGPVYSWVDISAVGTNAGRGNNVSFGPFNLGFTFRFYGTNFTSVRICDNGFLSFTSTSTVSTNPGMPSTANPNNVVAPFWDNLNVTTTGMLKYYADTANQRFIVSWLGVPRSGTTQYETFQVVLYATGRIVCQYRTMTGTLNSATIGIENAAGTTGLQVVYNAAYIANNRAIEFSTQTPWLSIAPTSGTVAAGGSGILTANYNAASLVAGTYTGSVTVASNDPDEASVVVPVTLTVAALLAQAPNISLTCLGDTWSDLARPVSATITDAADVASAQLLYSINGGAQQSVAMTLTGGSTWTGSLPGLSAPGAVSYQVVTTDDDANKDVSAAYSYALIVLSAPAVQVSLAQYGQLTISWAAVAGATLYNVYSAPALNQPYTLTATTSATSLTLTANPGEKRVFKVCAVH